MQYTIVDIRDNRVVWSGSIRKGQTETSFYKRPVQESQRYGDATGTLAIIDVISGNNPADRYRKEARSAGERYPFPKPTPILTVVQGINKGFIQNIEKLDSKQI